VVVVIFDSITSVAQPDANKNAASASETATSDLGAAPRRR